jgi:hypothetical protein
MNSFIRCASGALVAAAAIVPTNYSAETSQEIRVGGVHFSKRFFSTLFGHPVDDSQKVRERIKSAITKGTSQTKGGVTVELKPASAHGRMDIRLRGTVNIDDAVASQGSVRVCSRSVTQVDVRKSVIFDRDGLHHEPASARCSTNIRICDVQATGWLAERFAARRSQRELHETEYIVARRTGQRFEDRLNNRIGTAVEEIDTQLREQLRFDLLQPQISFTSTKDDLQAWIKPHSDRKVSPPPQDGYLDTSFDVHLVLHEQVLDTLAEYRFAGRRVNGQQVRDGLEAWCGAVPQSLHVDPLQPQWSIRMADTKPLTVRLTDGQIDIVMQLADFQHGPNVLAGPIRVELALRPEITADRAILRRLAAPQIRIDQTRRTEPSDKDSQLADLLRQKIAGIFPPEFDFDRQPGSGDERWEKLRHLAVTRLNVAHEWLEMGFQFAAEPTAAGRTVRTE